LCDSCIKNIKDESPERCLVCAKVSLRQLCETCAGASPFAGVYFAGYRDGALKVLLNDYKFRRKKSASQSIAALLDELLPVFPGSTSVVSVPSSRKHTRQRGYDHMALVAKQFAGRRGYQYASVIARIEQYVQTGQTAQVRKQQAAAMFTIRQTLDPQQFYLVIDDIYTTGATVNAIAKQLQEAGARKVLLAIVARQDETMHE
jgi:ComF family protein